MKNKSRKPVRVLLPVVPYDCCYVGWIAWLESVLKRKPRRLRLDIMGAGEIPPDAALSIRHSLVKRSGKTRLITNARSSLQGGSVLVWLLGERRKIRDDAKVFFRRVDETEIKEVGIHEKWSEKESIFLDSFSQADPDEGDYARVVELIDEFLPVREFAGRLVGTEVLCQFGLVKHKRVDRFLHDAFRRNSGRKEKASGRTEAAVDESAAA